jgi:HAD superfamily hydrolase (TIGR01509 family)
MKIELEKMPDKLKAILFDCDGIIADTEPLHLAAFKQTLADEGIHLTDKQYYEEYLALDDRGCFKKAYSYYSKDLSFRKLQELIARKAHYFEPVLEKNLKLFPGVAEFIKIAAESYPLAIASGARRREIDLILTHGQLKDYFQAIISADDVVNGKPDPESFLLACERVKSTDASITPASCLVIEDSFHGIHAAVAAGMRCLAVTNSYPKEQLTEADLVVESLMGLPLEQLQFLF